MRITWRLFFPSAFSQDPYSDFYAQYVKWHRFARGCAFWGLENKILISTPPPSKKNRNFWPIFDRRVGKFWLQKAFTVAMFTCKLVLLFIVIVFQWRLYIVNRQIESGKSRNPNVGSPATAYLHLIWPSQSLHKKALKGLNMEDFTSKHLLL